MRYKSAFLRVSSMYFPLALRRNSGKANVNIKPCMYVWQSESGGGGAVVWVYVHLGLLDFEFVCLRARCFSFDHENRCGRSSFSLRACLYLLTLAYTRT